jgi:competence protein ComEC
MKQWIAERDWVSYFCILVIAGAATYSIFITAPVIPVLDNAVDTKVTIEGVIVRDPDVRQGVQMLTVDVGQKGMVLVQTDNYQEYFYGNRIRAVGKLEFPQPFDTDTGKTFNYPKYLLARGVTHTVSFAQVSVVDHGEGNFVVSELLGIKHILTNGIRAALPEPESALLEGLLLGNKQGLGKELTDSFRRAGVVHMIVLSGYNVTVVVNAILLVALLFLPRVWALTLAATGIVAFAIMTGASETTLRASLMALVALLAKGLYRPASGLRLLLIATAALALWNPLLVLYDLSFQLSVLSTLGLILFSERIAKSLSFVPEALNLREVSATTIATQVTVLPLLIYSVGQVSVVSRY